MTRASDLSWDDIVKVGPELSAAIIFANSGGRWRSPRK